MKIIGKQAANEYLDDNKKILKAYIYENFNDKNLINRLQKRKIDIKYLSKNEILKIDNNINQGIILIVEDFKFSSMDEINTNKENTIVMLDHINDSHNFGAIIRTCEAAGVKTIIIPKDRSVDINPAVVKSSVGAISRVKIIKVTNLLHALKQLKNQNYWIIGTDIEGTFNYNKIEYNMKSVLIIGNESKGMSQLIKKECDYLVKIPMKGKINSLNASVATGILLFKIIEN